MSWLQHLQCNRAVPIRLTTISATTIYSHRRSLTPSPMKFRHGTAGDLYNSGVFSSVVNNLRSHLLCPRSTRSIYIRNQSGTWMKFLTPCLRLISRKPTDKDLYEYIFDLWPEVGFFVLGEDLTCGIIWKGKCEPKQINILSSLV